MESRCLQMRSTFGLIQGSCHSHWQKWERHRQIYWACRQDQSDRTRAPASHNRGRAGLGRRRSDVQDRSEIVCSNPAVLEAPFDHHLTELIRICVSLGEVAFGASDTQVPSHVRASQGKRLLVVHVPLSRMGHFLAPVAEKHWSMDRLGIDPPDWTAPANLATRSEEHTS